MAFYTFQCRTCNLEKEEMRSIGDFSEPLCPECSHNPEIQGKSERMKKIIDKVGGKPIFKCNGFYETDYVKNRNRKVKAVYDIERKKEDVIENMHKNASKAFPKNDIKPIPRGKMSNMSAEKQVLDNTDPLMGPIIKRKSGKLDKL